MARSIDRLISRGLYPLDDQGVETASGLANFKKYRSGLADVLPRAEVIVIDNVAEYFYAGNDKEEWDEVQDFPNVAPPFDLFWMEYKRPSKSVSRETGVRDTKGMPRYSGFLIGSVSHKDLAAELENPEWIRKVMADTDKRLDNSAAVLMPGIQEKLVRYGPEEAALQVTETERAFLGEWKARDALRRDAPGVLKEVLLDGWTMTIAGFMESDEGIIGGPIASWVCDVASDGRLRRRPSMMKVGFGSTMSVPDDAFKNLNPYLFPVFLALSFLHCKNVTMQVVDTPRKIQQSRKKEGKKPFVRYHVLEIEPMKTVLKSEGKKETHGLQQALHICRGHFADYRNGRGLFGRHQGVYWWDSHLRGSVSHGVIVKDYAVKYP